MFADSLNYHLFRYSRFFSAAYSALIVLLQVAKTHYCRWWCGAVDAGVAVGVPLKKCESENVWNLNEFTF